ncbi:MAG TPA: LysE family translocator [Azospirillaceae bacterium]|nr:LysE family translocator [Azospirillaceae bacterium]
MPTAETLGLMAAVALALGLTPGPDMLFCFASGVERGPRGGLAASCGILLGLAAHIAAAILGVSALIAASPAAFEAVRWGGAAYLLWLAWKSVTAPATLPEAEAATGGLSAIFWKGTLTCVTNPKLLLFFLALLPQFVRPEQGAVPLQMLVLSLVFIAPGVTANTAVGVSGAGVGRALRRHPGWMRALNVAVGLVFAALALKLLLERAG